MKSSITRLCLLVCTALLLSVGCNDSSVDNAAKDFSIYLVEKLTAKEAMDKNLSDLTLESEPVLTDKEIKIYNWEEHTFTLDKDFSLEEKLDGKVPLSGRPFVVVVGGERIYMGSFWSPLSSLYNPDIPIINSIWAKDFDRDTYAIVCGNKERDPRNDKRIYESLKDLGKITE